MLFLAELNVLASVILFFAFIDIGVKNLAGIEINRKFTVCAVVISYKFGDSCHFVWGQLFVDKGKYSCWYRF